MEGVARSGLAALAVSGVAGPLAAGGARVLAHLGGGVALLSQAVSNVPAVMLFVPAIESVPPGSAEPLWLATAAFSTLAGNLTIIASLANIIVFESAEREGVHISFGEYLRAGLPITLGTLVLAWLWLSL
jgi:Na+/H+ antiporter NhaD/arsenite permease-like protein